jgi:hypothetical protein
MTAICLPGRSPASKNAIVETAQPMKGSVPPQSRLKAKPATPETARLTEDEIAREKLGPRGVPGAPDTTKMTAQEEKNISRCGKFDGHTA